MELAGLGGHSQLLGGRQLVLEGLLQDRSIFGVLQALLFTGLPGAQRGSSCGRVHDEW